MCLDSLTTRPSVPPGGTVPAWKVFRTERGMLFAEFKGNVPALDNPGYTEGTWIGAERKVCSAKDGAAYMSGFHAFTDKDDAKDWCWGWEVVRQVLLRDVHTGGLQKLFGTPRLVVVANEMMVLPEGGLPHVP